MEYLVKTRYDTGESITFITGLRDEDDLFPGLTDNEYLYFDYEKNWQLFHNLPKGGRAEHIYYTDAEIVNFVVYKRRPQSPEYVGLTVEEAQARALDKNLSFRTVMENGVEVSHDANINLSRVNVYVNNNIVYRAEIF